jgi:phosphoenolpyruvate synthase/pyruvate phosphate dikinase
MQKGRNDGNLFTFKDSALPTVEEVGGKGFSLIYSANKGFPVPMAVVLSTNFFSP